MVRPLAPLIVVLGLLVGCAPSPPAPTPPALTPMEVTVAPAPSIALSPMPSPSLTVSPEALGPLEAARRDLATRLNVSLDQIQVLDVQSRDWPDSSLGCPQPGTTYAQVITPGYLTMLGNGQRRYEYHTDRTTRVTLCREG
jgi:hypothetical protein